MLTEDEFRSGLMSMTADQPPAAADRMSGVRRLHRRRRMAQSAVAIVGAFAVLGGAVSVVAHLGTARVSAAQRDVPSWALPWPDHDNGSLSAAQKTAAVRTWESTWDGGQRAPESAAASVIWYVAERAVSTQAVSSAAAHEADQVGLVVFEATKPNGQHRIVSAWDNDLTGGASCGQACSNWAVFSAPAPAADFTGVLGINFHPASQPLPQSGPADWVLLLTAPRFRTANVSGIGLSDKPFFVFSDLHSGLAIMNVGSLYTGPLTTVRVGTSAGADTPEAVGLPGNHQSQIPQLATVTVPTKGMLLSGGAAQETSTFGMGGLTKPQTSIRFEFRCRGTGGARVALDSSGSNPRVTRRWTCNDQLHVVRLPGLPPRASWKAVAVRAGEAAWAFRLYRVRN